MKKKKGLIIVGLLVLMVIVGGIIFNHNKTLNNKNTKYSDSQIAIYIDDGSGNYVLSDSKEFPIDDRHELNTEKSTCSNNGIVLQNPDTKLINLNVSNGTICYLYFDKTPYVHSSSNSNGITTLNSLNLTFSTDTPNYGSQVPSLVEYKDNEFEDETLYPNGSNSFYSTYNKTSYYYTYSDSYSFDKNTGLYTLINPKVGKWADIYEEIYTNFFYIVDIFGSTSSQKAEYTNLNQIYRISDGPSAVSLNGFYYRKSSYSEIYDNSGSGIYSMEDDYGTSYYFRGNVTNNYVKFGKWSDSVYRGYDSSYKQYYHDFFSKQECQNSSEFSYECELSPASGADMYWRIIRVNGNGSLRIIYDGISPSETGERQVNERYEESDTNSNASMGYMYGSVESNTYEGTHANINNSSIKNYLDKWYVNNFGDTIYEEKISDEIFCNDRSLDTTRSTYTGIGTTTTYYGAYQRLVRNTVSPSLICPQKNDAFTENDVIKGNGALTYPIGLITADELILNGSSANGNITKNNFLYSNIYSRTMTPKYYSSYRYFFHIGNGSSGNYASPVINLSSETAQSLIGTGTMTDPYRLPE